MPTFRQMSETVSPLARSRSASRSNRATSSAVLRLLMGPSVSQSTRRLPFRLDQFLGSRPGRVEPSVEAIGRHPLRPVVPWCEGEQNAYASVTRININLSRGLNSRAFLVLRGVNEFFMRVVDFLIHIVDIDCALLLWFAIVT